jgi:hypothetical protein
VAVWVQQKIFNEDFDLFSRPCLSEIKDESEVYSTQARYPTLYFSYDSGTLRTAVLTNELNEGHVRMVDHVKDFAKNPSRPEEVAFQLLFE